MKAKAEVYDYVTERIIARLEQGEVPWINTRSKPLLLARSATTGKIYHGINAFLLSNSSHASAFLGHLPHSATNGRQRQERRTLRDVRLLEAVRDKGNGP